MLSSLDIKNVKFSKSTIGYNREEVDVLLDKIEADYAQYERQFKDFQNKIEGLNKEIEGYKTAQSSVQNVLLNAQKFADQIVDEAKIKSAQIINDSENNIEEITRREKELAEAFEIKANERRGALEAELTGAVNSANKKAAGIIAAAEDSVRRQQVLFNKLKVEIAAFKSDITQKYREHLENLQTLPDTVGMDPKTIAEAVSAAVDRDPEPESFIADDTKEEFIEETEVIGQGFAVNGDLMDQTD